MIWRFLIAAYLFVIMPMTAAVAQMPALDNPFNLLLFALALLLTGTGLILLEPRRR